MGYLNQPSLGYSAHRVIFLQIFISLILVSLLVVSDDKKTDHRRLEVDRRGYPMWFSVADRTLMSQGLVQPNATVAKDGSGQFKTVLTHIQVIIEENILYTLRLVYTKSILPSIKTKITLYYTVMALHKRSSPLLLPQTDTFGKLTIN